MVVLRTLLIPINLLLASVEATYLYVAETNSNLTTLSLIRTNETSSLTILSKTPDCGPNPSDLSLDFDNRILYCMDRGASSSVNGSINSFEIGLEGNLARIARTDGPLSIVASTRFGGDGNQGIVTVSYNKSAISVTGIGSSGELTPITSFAPNFITPGPVTARQDRSYLHQAMVDPSNKYLIMNDLGADVVRVYSWDRENLAPLTEVSQLKTDPGTGPRHGVFWTSSNGTLYYFFNGELSQKVYSYSIQYTDCGMSWTKVFEIPALGFDNEKPALTAPTSEIALTPDNRFIIVSNRDVSFPNSTQYLSGPTDTLSTLSIQDDGTLSLIQLAPSGGYSPRQFSINNAGDLIAVGHQNNRTVTIWERDLETGNIIVGEPVGTVTLTGQVVMTVWDEA